MTIPKRRGRPPASAVAASDPIHDAAPADGAPAPRRRRASVGGLKLKLAHPQREGYMRRWFNGTPERLAEAEEMAYDHVCDPSIKSDSPDSRIRRQVGILANGQPQYQYLMETPLVEYRRGIEEKEEAHRAVDEAIREGRHATDRMSNTYGESSIQVG